jgi:predicted RNA binding protein YcfA (HicA-like mRNA interferase family)
VPAFGPIRRNDLLRALRAAGFEGPFSGSKHQFMIRGARTLRVPNPHQADIGRELLSRLLRQAGIERDEWERL